MPGKAVRRTGSAVTGRWPSRRSGSGLVVAAVLLTACGPTGGGVATQSTAMPDGRHDRELHVVVSMSVIADLVRQVGGPGLFVTSLVPLGGDPHVHEATPSDARAIQDADLLFGNGAGLEPWFTTLAAGGGRTPVMLADVLADEVVVDADGRPDPHLWMVPTMAARYVERIADELARIDPGQAQAYQDAAQQAVKRFAELDAELRRELERIPAHRRVIVTTHDAYTYFATHYGFEVATIVGISTDEEPSAARIRQLITLVRERDIPTVFAESSVNPAVIRRIAQDAGVALGRDLYGDSLGPPGSGAEDYVAMLRWNVAALVAGLAHQ